MYTNKTSSCFSNLIEKSVVCYRNFFFRYNRTRRNETDALKRFLIKTYWAVSKKKKKQITLASLFFNNNRRKYNGNNASGNCYD